MFHINDKQEARPCRAKTPEACRFYQDEKDTRHYQTASEAAAVSQQLLEDKYGKINSQDRYSFTARFAQLEDRFEKDFSGTPTRFFNADLRGKLLPSTVDPRVLMSKLTLGSEDAETRVHGRYLQANKLYARMAQAMSTPKDNDTPSAEVVKAAEEQGIEDFQEVKGSYFRAKRAWRGVVGGKTVVVTDERAGEDLATYGFRRRPADWEGSNNYKLLTVRTLIGSQRIKNKTGGSMIGPIVSERTPEDRTVNRVLTLHVLAELEDAQREGNDFLSQKKYVKTHDGKVATAWMDKKNPDKVRKDLMENHKLGKTFRAVEIDNDVDPVEYNDFESEVNSTMKKLPRVPEERMPELRIRRLGKHKAEGVFFPHKSTVCVDIRTSEAFVHEMGHYYDLVVHNNASLSKEFRDITKEYTAALEPDNPNKADYYRTPTEIFARGFEIYAHKKLGVDNRLLNPKKFTRFDYTPFTENPDLEKRLFSLLDRTLK